MNPWNNYKPTAGELLLVKARDTLIPDDQHHTGWVCLILSAQYRFINQDYVICYIELGASIPKWGTISDATQMWSKA